jgi:hypothetical protein
MLEYHSSRSNGMVRYKMIVNNNTEINNHQELFLNGPRNGGRLLFNFVPEPPLYFQFLKESRN